MRLQPMRPTQPTVTVLAISKVAVASGLKWGSLSCSIAKAFWYATTSDSRQSGTAHIRKVDVKFKYVPIERLGEVNSRAADPENNKIQLLNFCKFGMNRR
jgi:hypothetical protein